MKRSESLNPNSSTTPSNTGPCWMLYWKRPVGILVLTLLAAAITLAGLWLVSAWQQNQAGTASGGVTLPGVWQRPVVSDEGLAEKIGVRITQVALTGDGGLIDLRFQVLDPDKAAVLHNPGTPPALVDDATGLVANDLLMGHSHSDPFIAGITYYLIFENPGNLVQHGGTVSVLLGNNEVDHVTVR